MPSLQKLKEAQTLSDFAALLNCSVKTLVDILYAEGNDNYFSFRIDKKSGGSRLINAPNETLKVMQKKLAEIINNCMQEISTDEQSIKNLTNRSSLVRPLSHGFQKKKKLSNGDNKSDLNDLTLGIHTNAKCHKNKKYVLNLDLEDFFSSFNFGRVRGFFIKNRDFCLHEKIATILAQIACYQNGLPQGSPCSPVITNIITHILDVRLAQLAKKYKCYYSRYADDITFSTNQKDFPKELACSTGKLGLYQVGSKIEAIIERSGFKVNSKKTRLQVHTSRQVVTGLVVNKKVNINQEYYRPARSMCNSLFNTGSFCMQGNTERAKINQLEGILSYIYFIKKFSWTAEEVDLLEKAKKNRNSIEFGGISKLYFKFLYFRYFVALEKPLIVCEGKTDISYLKCAIKKLCQNGSYKNLYGIGKNNFKINFLNPTSRIRDVISIAPGAGGLKNLIAFYQKNTDFQCRKEVQKQPVIIILDNDIATHQILALVAINNNDNDKGEGGKRNSSSAATDGSNFLTSQEESNRKEKFIYKVLPNLFLIFLPAKENECVKIEDFVPSEVREEAIDIKVNKFSEEQKTALVVHVKKNSESIDFSNFKPILSLIDDAINTYNKSLTAPNQNP
jgi:hypothetical protein